MPEYIFIILPKKTKGHSFHSEITFFELKATLIISMIFQGETTARYGNYTCTGGRFEGLIVVGTVSLKFTGALTCNGAAMNGTWEIRNNGVLLDTGNFSGQKLY